MAKNDIVFYACVIDSTQTFVDSVSSTLSKALSLSGFPDFEVKGFKYVKNYEGLLEKKPYIIPLIVIADTDAKQPSIEDGVFVKTKRLVPRATCIAYTSTPDPEIEPWERLLKIGTIESPRHLVQQGDEEKLLQITRQIKDEFCNSPDYRGIVTLQEKLKQGTIINKSGQDLLIEAARKTDKGLRFLYGKERRAPEQREPADNKEKHETHTPEMAYKPDLTLMNKIIRPGSYVWRLLERPRLRFWEKIIVRDVARCKFVRMSRNNDLELAKSFKILFLSQQYPKDKECLQIICETFNEVFARSTRI